MKLGHAIISVCRETGILFFDIRLPISQTQHGVMRRRLVSWRWAMHLHMRHATQSGSAQTSAPINTSSIMVDRVSLSCGNVLYRQLGSGPPLILLHGWATSSRFWLTTLPQLASMRSCYALDMPGFGETAALTEPTTIARLAAVVIEFADALGLQRFDLNTHSFGATIGIYIAAHWPERVGQLVLTSYGILHDSETAWYLLARSYLQISQILWQPVYNQLDPFFKLIQPLTQLWVKLPPFPQFLGALLFEKPPADLRVIEDEVSDVARMDIRAHIGCLLSSGDPDLLQALPKIKAPTLLIYGNKDRLVPPSGVAELHASIPHSQLYVIPDCGHVPVFEHAELYYATLRRFLQDAVYPAV